MQHTHYRKTLEMTWSWTNFIGWTAAPAEHLASQPSGGTIKPKSGKFWPRCKGCLPCCPPASPLATPGRPLDPSTSLSKGFLTFNPSSSLPLTRSIPSLSRVWHVGQGSQNLTFSRQYKQAGASASYLQCREVEVRFSNLSISTFLTFAGSLPGAILPPPSLGHSPSRRIVEDDDEDWCWCKCTIQAQSGGSI